MKNMNVSIFSGKQKKTKKEMEENPTFQGPYNLVIDGYFGGLSFRFLSRHKEVPPLIYFSLSELLVIGSTFSQLLTKTVVRGKYFNMNSASWENFVEPFEITFGVFIFIYFFLNTQMNLLNFSIVFSRSF